MVILVQAIDEIITQAGAIRGGATEYLEANAIKPVDAIFRTEP